MEMEIKNIAICVGIKICVIAPSIRMLQYYNVLSICYSSNVRRKKKMALIIFIKENS